MKEESTPEVCVHRSGTHGRRYWRVERANCVLYCIASSRRYTEVTQFRSCDLGPTLISMATRVNTFVMKMSVAWCTRQWWRWLGNILMSVGTILSLSPSLSCHTLTRARAHHHACALVCEGEREKREVKGAKIDEKGFRDCTRRFKYLEALLTNSLCSNSECDYNKGDAFTWFTAVIHSVTTDAAGGQELSQRVIDLTGRGKSIPGIAILLKLMVSC